MVDGQRRILASLGPELPLSVVDPYSLAVQRENQRRQVLRSAAGDRRVEKVLEIGTISEDLRTGLH